MTSQPLSTLQQLLEAKDTPGPDRYDVFFLKRTGKLGFWETWLQNKTDPLDTAFFISLVIWRPSIPCFWTEGKEVNGMTWWLIFRRQVDRELSPAILLEHPHPSTSEEVPLCSSFSMQTRILHSLFKTQSLQNKINTPFPSPKPQDNFNLRRRGKTTWQHC